jgi:HKD family nuclease
MHNSSLYDEKTFYDQFIADLKNCKEEVIIECPFITSARIQIFYPLFEKLLRKNVRIYIMTRDPQKHTEPYKNQSEHAIQMFEHMGVQPLICTGNHHRKLAILDRKVLWEGSLNILSQIHSRKIMRRIDSKEITLEMFHFLNFARFL